MMVLLNGKEIEMAYIQNKVTYNVTEFSEQITIEKIDSSEQKITIDIPCHVVFELYNKMVKNGIYGAYKNDRNN